MIKEKILHFKDTTDTFLIQIDKIVQINGVGLSLFILTSCLIDTLSFYTTDKEKNGERYKAFILKYLSKSNANYSDKQVVKRIYESVRCSIVHSFTINSGVVLGESMPSMHLTTDFHGNLLIDLDSFYSDIKKSIAKVYKDLDNDVQLQKIFNKRYQLQPPFEVYKTVEMFDKTNFAVSGITSLPKKSYKVINYGRRKNN
jgi:hypothetical protein